MNGPLSGRLRRMNFFEARKARWQPSSGGLSPFSFGLALGHVFLGLGKAVTRSPPDAVEAAVAEPDRLDSRRAQAVNHKAEEGLLPEVLRAGQLRLVAGRDGEARSLSRLTQRGDQRGAGLLLREAEGS